MVRKTTLLLRDDVYQMLKEKAGNKKISNLVNEIIIEYFTKKSSMFGSMKHVDIRDLRDHGDRL